MINNVKTQMNDYKIDLLDCLRGEDRIHTIVSTSIFSSFVRNIHFLLFDYF